MYRVLIEIHGASKNLFTKLFYNEFPSNRIKFFLSFISMTSKSRVPGKHASAAQLQYTHVLVYIFGSFDYFSENIAYAE